MLCTVRSDQAQSKPASCLNWPGQNSSSSPVVTKTPAPSIMPMPRQMRSITLCSMRQGGGGGTKRAKPASGDVNRKSVVTPRSQWPSAGMPQGICCCRSNAMDHAADRCTHLGAHGEPGPLTHPRCHQGRRAVCVCMNAA